MLEERPCAPFFWLEAGIFHYAQYCQGRFDVAAADVCLEECLVLVKLEPCLAVAENAEDIRCQVCIAVASGSRKNIKANTGWRVQVRRFDSFLPGVEGGFVL